MTAEWGTDYCRYEAVVDSPGQVKVTTLDYNCTDTVIEDEEEYKGVRAGRVDVSDDNRVYALPALLNVPEHVMTGWVQTALGPAMVAALEADAVPEIPDETTDPPTGGFEPE